MGKFADRYFQIHPWIVAEDGFDPKHSQAAESIFSLGNEYTGLRGYFDEGYSGKSLVGSYLNGVYERRMLQKSGYKGMLSFTEFMVNTVDWVYTRITCNGETLDLAKSRFSDFHRVLDLRTGILTRSFLWHVDDKTTVEVAFERFTSMEKEQFVGQKVTLKAVTGTADVTFRAGLDFTRPHVSAEAPMFETEMAGADGNQCRILAATKTTKQQVYAAAAFRGLPGTPWQEEAGIASNGFHAVLNPGQSAKLERVVVLLTGKNAAEQESLPQRIAEANTALAQTDYEALKAESAAWWENQWKVSDIEICGDEVNQQGIRFCIFMLLQTYTGVDTRLNIGPKGFTGEKYGGVTYWDTEAYCLPFYLATAGRAVARELLVYRYNQLDKAIENAAKLGFRDGAALFPMVTVNGEECHNEWEITFEEIHRNGAVAYAIFNYIRYTGDTAYLADCGLEVLLSVARFWAQRITWSGARQKYVMLGVTGPNEYENNVDNNWYTSYIACWSMRYAAESAAWVRENRPADYARICAKRRFDETAETKRWLEIADGMYFGEDRELGIFLQQDGYLDKEQTLAKDLDPADRPINQRWSWDRILRSCLIKQADVLQGLYFFGDDFDLDTVRRNFRFYEARTVHESSLSPCVHAILAARIGDLDKAYELYLRTARLDLDDYNREVREGCHVTSMAGSWLSVVEGFGGMRVRDGVLSFDPQLPAAWESLSFKVNFRDRVLTVRITRNAVEVANEGAPVELEIRGVRRLIADKVIMNCEL